MKKVQAYTQWLDEIPYAIYEDEGDFVVHYDHLKRDSFHLTYVKNRVNRRNKQKARCTIGKVVWK